MSARRKLSGGWALAVPAILALSAKVAFAPPDVYPVAGTVGTRITLYGGGFGDAKGKVTLTDASTGATTTIKVVTWSDDHVVADITRMPKSGLIEYEVDFTPKGESWSSMVQSFTFAPLEIAAVTPETGAPGDSVTVSGSYFGLKPGKVYLQYPNPKKPGSLLKSCKVTSWTMDPTTGESEAVCIIPKTPPGTYTLTMQGPVSGTFWSNDITVTEP